MSSPAPDPSLPPFPDHPSPLTERRIAAILAGVCFLYLGSGLLTTLLNVRMVREGFAPGMIGPINSAFSLGGVLGALYCGKAIFSVGHIRAFAAFAALLAATTLGHALLVHPLLWGLFRLTAGFFFYGLMMISESWLNFQTDARFRSRILAQYMIASYLALTLSQFLLAADTPMENDMLIVSAIMIVLALVPIALYRAVEPPRIPTRRRGLSQLYHISPLALLGAFCAGYLANSFYTLGPVFSGKIGMHVTDISLFMAITVFGALLFQWPAGWLADRLGRPRTLVLMCSLVVIIGLLVALSRLANHPPLFLMMFLLGGAVFCLYPISLAKANDYIDPDMVIEVSRGMLFVYALGCILSPTIGGMLIAYFGPYAFFGQFAVVAALLLVIAVFGETLPRVQRGVYVPIPQTSTVASSTLDPRQDQDWAEEVLESRDS